MKRRSVRLALALLAVAAVTMSACTTNRSPGAQPVPAPLPLPSSPQVVQVLQAAPAVAAATAAPIQYMGRFSLSPENAPAGSRVRATGTGLPANTELQVNWHTVEGTWLLKGKWNDEFHGREFKDVARTLATVQTDARGDFTTEFTVPDEFGFDHDVSVVEAKTGIVRNKSNFSADMQVTISPTSGPVGTPITISARGIGHRYMYNSWVLMYDNKLTGWLSSVTTAGKATAVIPAAGKPGKHVIKVMHGWSSQAYLNPHQSSEPERPQFLFEFTITEGEAVQPLPLEKQGLAPEPGVAPSGTGPALWTSPATGSLDMPVKLSGRGLPPGQQVDLTWVTMAGSRLEGWDIQERFRPFGKATVGSDGNLAFDFKVPDDLGGWHRIEARIGDKVVAGGGFIITPKVVAVDPPRGPVGSTIRINLKGVGWTETANIYHLVYDNAYIGYACGFKSSGDVEIFLPATGEPGWHFIDLYPGIYKGKDITGVINFRTPQLTAEQDHPGERLPVFRLAYFVTP